jgi:hypothetical protein
MHNSPAGTGDWFGWANAMVSELIPLAAGLEARRRMRQFGRAGVYPVALIVAAVALSLTGQFAEAKPSVSGWLIAAVPAIGFLALVKLVLSSPTAGPAGDNSVSTSSAATPAPAGEASRALVPAGVEVPAHLVAAARFAATQHLHATGQPISAADLAARLSITPVRAASALAQLHAEDTTARVNGHPVGVQ